MKGLTLSFEIVSPVSQLLSEVYEISIASEIFLSLPVGSYPRDNHCSRFCNCRLFLSVLQL